MLNKKWRQRLGHGTECISVGKHTPNGGNKRGDWMKHWLMLQGFTALNTVYRKNLGKPTTCISPKGNGKQIDYILTTRRNLRYNKDAEANDMIHMGSGHRCVMATFTITTPGKSNHHKTLKGNHDIIKHDGRDQKGKNIEVEKRELEKRYQEIIEKKKKTPPQKKQQRKQKAKMQKHQQIMRMQQAEAKSENTEAEAEKVEGTCTGTMVNDGVETTGEAGGRHPGLHTQ